MMKYFIRNNINLALKWSLKKKKQFYINIKEFLLGKIKSINAIIQSIYFIDLK